MRPVGPDLLMWQTCGRCRALLVGGHIETGEFRALNVDEPVAAGPGTYRIAQDAGMSPHKLRSASPLLDPPGTRYYRPHAETCDFRPQW